MQAAGLIAVAVFGLATACGGGSSGGGQPAGSTKVSMSEFKFNPSSLSVKAGTAVFYLVNVGSTSHDMVITDSSNKQIAKSDLVQAGASSTFTVNNLASGSYTTFCDLPGHRDSGMQGTLQVT